MRRELTTLAIYHPRAAAHHAGRALTLLGDALILARAAVLADDGVSVQRHSEPIPEVNVGFAPGREPQA